MTGDQALEPKKGPDSTFACQAGGCCVTVHNRDCVAGMRGDLDPGGVDVVVTSPPYNLGIRYKQYDDALPREEYLNWLGEWADAVKEVLAVCRTSVPLCSARSTLVDVQMAARSVLAVWGEHPGDPKIPEAVTGPVALALRAGARGEIPDAWELRETIDAAAREQFGPPRYSPLVMPGWR